MIQKLVLIWVTGLLGSFGIWQLAYPSALTPVYVAASAILLLCTCIGGVVQYTSQEMRDFREVYRERAAQNKTQLETLKEALVLKEKELLNAKSNAEKIVNGGEIGAACLHSN